MTITFASRFMWPATTTLGAHHTNAGLVSKAMRAASRPTPHHWTREPFSYEAASQALTDWATNLDLGDVDALCWIPGHDRTPGPGHATANLIAAATGLPLIGACERSTVIASASTGTRQHWTAHARTMTAPSRYGQRRLAVIDNTIATGHSARAAIFTLTQAGHHVTHLLAASHTAH